jgi:hypothetical protein
MSRHWVSVSRFGLVAVIQLSLPLLASGTFGQSIPRASGDELLRYRGCLLNAFDSRGWPVWTPSLPGVLSRSDGSIVWAEWAQLLGDCGATHVPIGGFDVGGGPAYHAADGARTPPETDNPDWRQSPAKVRALAEKLLSTPSADGKGFRPVIFLSGGALRREIIDRQWPALAAALDGLQDSVIYVPAWEPVAGEATSRELSYALERGKALFGERSHWFLHLSPGRNDGASRPLEADDPWQGRASSFFARHGGQFVEGLLFQTPHGRAVTEPCARTLSGSDSHGDGAVYPGACWLKEFEDAVSRLGAGVCLDDLGHRRPCEGRRLRVVLFETNTYEFFRKKSDAADGRRIASEARRVCDSYGVECGFGAGIPE